MAPFKAISGAGAGAGVGLQPHAPSYWRWRSRSTTKATADYHSSLLDREDRRCWDDQAAAAADDSYPPRPRTSHISDSRPTQTTATAQGRSSWSLRRPSSSKSTKKSNPFRSDDVPELPPIAAEFSRRELAEFSALPIAIRRKVRASFLAVFVFFLPSGWSIGRFPQFVPSPCSFLPPLHLPSVT